MSVFLSKVISILFHPIFMPLFTLFLIFNADGIINHYFAGRSPYTGEDQRSRVYLVFFITTVLMPAVSFYILKRNKLVSSFAMPHKNERFFPYLTTVVYYAILYYLLQSNNFPLVFKTATLGTIAVVLCVMLINFRFKISSHAAGIGGVVGIYAVLIKHSWILNGVGTLALLVVLAGLVSTARLSLNAHRAVEVYSGLLLGFLLEFVFMHYKITI
ncbi:MAG TPA: hypothetical protein VD905_08330 [Flavobacteriales bacterium]|nr:hypothetical protein [Flavobacteriales bacterium]